MDMRKRMEEMATPSASPSLKEMADYINRHSDTYRAAFIPGRIAKEMLRVSLAKDYTHIITFVHTQEVNDMAPAAARWVLDNVPEKRQRVSIWATSPQIKE